MADSIDDLRRKALVAQRLLDDLKAQTEKEQDAVEQAEADYGYQSPQHSRAKYELDLTFDDYARAKSSLARAKAELSVADELEKGEPQKERWFLQEHGEQKQPEQSREAEEERERQERAAALLDDLDLPKEPTR